MDKRRENLLKWTQTALLAALCFVSFTFLQIKIPMPGGDATSLGAVGMTIADLLDPVYLVSAPKTFVLKLGIGLITGLVAHRIAKIGESRDQKYIFKWSILASVCGLAFNVVFDPLVGYFYKMYILGERAGKMEYGDYVCKCGRVGDSGGAVVSCAAAAAGEGGDSGETPVRR